jgi:hypothetical protein
MHHRFLPAIANQKKYATPSSGLPELLDPVYYSYLRIITFQSFTGDQTIQNGYPNKFLGDQHRELGWRAIFSPPQTLGQNPMRSLVYYATPCQYLLECPAPSIFRVLFSDVSCRFAPPPRESSNLPSICLGRLGPSGPTSHRLESMIVQFCQVVVSISSKGRRSVRLRSAESRIKIMVGVLRPLKVLYVEFEGNMNCMRFLTNGKLCPSVLHLVVDVFSAFEPSCSPSGRLQGIEHHGVPEVLGRCSPDPKTVMFALA